MHHFVTINNKYLKNEHGLKISTEIHVSGGSAMRYKSKTPFADVTYSVEDFRFPIQKHFFRSRDSESSIVKTFASVAVKNRKAVIMSHESMYPYCVDHLARLSVEDQDTCCHQRQKFFSVSKGDICHVRPEWVPSTLPGT